MNEPVANACRTCGRWPSLFELEGSTIEADEPISDEDGFAPQTVEVEQLEPEVFEPDVPDQTMPPEFEPDEKEVEPEKQRRRQLARLILPIGIVVYIAIRALVDR